MLGWHISIFRQTDGGVSPATAASPEGARVAVWQTGWDGLDWLDELVKAGKAINIGGDGYPNRYSAMAEHLIPRVIEEPPEARNLWVHGDSDILTSKWEGKTVVDRAVAAQCRSDEWLLVEAWDES